MEEKLRLLGVDFGLVRIGLALSDPSGTICTPLTTMTAKGTPDDQKQIAKLADQYDAKKIVIGLPIKLDGSYGPMARKVQEFRRQLKGYTSLPIIMHDERLTSVEAEKRLKIGGIKFTRKKERVDAAAAAILLENFLSLAQSR